VQGVPGIARSLRTVSSRRRSIAVAVGKSLGPAVLRSQIPEFLFGQDFHAPSPTGYRPEKSSNFWAGFWPEAAVSAAPQRELRARPRSLTARAATGRYLRLRRRSTWTRCRC